MEAAVHMAFSTLILFSPAALLAQAPARRQQPEFIKQGQQLMREGKLEEALALYRQTLQSSPVSLPANIAAGDVLDLMGKGEDARKYFQKAIDVAEKPEQKASAERAMAMSYAFQGNCKKTVEFEQKVFDYYVSVRDFFQQGEIADEAARVCIDSGDLDTALHWYQVGHDTGLKEPDIKPARVDLWNFRWEHAQARLAARRGNFSEAQDHVTAAKAILDKGAIPEQAQFVPYLRGYVGFLPARLQDRDGRIAHSESERSLHPVPAGPDLRESRREGQGHRVLSQGGCGHCPQSTSRLRRPFREETSRFFSRIDLWFAEPLNFVSESWSFFWLAKVST